MAEKRSNILMLITFIVIGSVFIITPMIGIPIYNVWQKGLSGKADLRRAEQQKQILIEQAKAEKEAAEYRAEAIEVMGKMAAKYPEYRHQEFIGAFAQALEDGKIQQIIYVPTEANIPIVEVGRILKSD